MKKKFINSPNVIYDGRSVRLTKEAEEDALKRLSYSGDMKEMVEEMNKNEGIFNKINEFLKVWKPSDGGWAKVEDAEVDQLRDIISGLIATKYEPDPDGAHPIEVEIVNRNKYERMHFFQVPYTHKNKEAAVSAHILNLKIAAQRLNDVQWFLQDKRREEDEQKKARKS